MVRQTSDLSNYFSGAKQSQKLSEAEAEIQRLKQEIEQLRSSGANASEEQIEELRDKLEHQSGILSVSINEIQPNLEQPRQTFLNESIDAMSRSLEREGQLEPIILIKQDHLLLFDGERRWRAAQALGWDHLNAVIIEPIEALHRKALITSLHREDLNPLDKAEAIVKELATETDCSADDIPRILSTAVRRLNKNKKMTQVVELMNESQEYQKEKLSSLDLNEQEQKIIISLLILQLNPASIDANIFPMLSLASDLKEAIRNQGLKGVQAMALQTLNAKNLGISEQKAEAIRIKTTQQVIQEKLSAVETRKLVAQIRQKYQDAPKSEKKVKQITNVTGSLSKINQKVLAKADLEQLKEFRLLLSEKLATIETVLKDKEESS
jgi:ParB family chromosome partitioning protein